MKAPDKIYIFQDGDEHWYKPEEWETPPPNRVEYIRNDSLQQEQPEVDLENYLENYFMGWYIDETIGLTKPDGWSCIVDDLKDVARHFYELGLNARNEK